MAVNEALNFNNDADDDTGEGRAGQSQGAPAGWR